MKDGIQVSAMTVKESSPLRKINLTFSLLPAFVTNDVMWGMTLTILLLVCIIIVLSYLWHVQIQIQRKKDKEQESLNKQYRLVLQANRTAIWTWNLHSRMIDFESEGCLCNEIPDICKHIYVTEDSFYSRVHPDDLDRVRSVYTDLLEGKTYMFHEEFRYKLLAAPEVYNWVESFAVVGDIDENGNICTLVGGIIVTTERKFLEQEAKKKEQAEEANRMKSAFLSSIRHEIRTPLNAIVGFSNLIAQGSEPDEATEYIKIVQQNNALLVKMVDDILDLSDIEFGKIQFKYITVDIAEKISMLAQKFRSIANNGVELLCEVPDESFYVEVDNNRVVQVLSNLLSNACKFTLSGYIKIGFRLSERGLYFYVTDTGKGIAEENISQVFERFAKFDPFIPGAGLGLSLSKVIVNKMGGEIGVVSEEGKGSTFWFDIPCKLKNNEKLKQQAAKALLNEIV